MKNLSRFILFSVIAHLILLLVIDPIWPFLHTIEPTSNNSMSVTIEAIERVEKAEEEKEKQPEPDPKGQIVDLPDPVEEKKPKKAKYLAEKSRSVKKQTRTRFKVNPKVLSEEYKSESKLKFEEAVDVNAKEPSSGAKVGNNSFKPAKDGVIASLPSPYLVTNKDGMQKPTYASSTESDLSGAPNNDLLNEEYSDRVRLNTNAYRYASYMNQIRRLVNFYWNQNLKNVDQPLVKPKYRTVVEVIITQTGKLHLIEVEKPSGAEELDQCVIDAFHSATPFPPPPKGLLSKDGMVHLPSFGFEVQIGRGSARYQGVDPRSNVRFPGILKAPR